MSTIEVKVPDIGDFSDVPVIGIMVAAGDEVNEEDPLIELESDKATMEVPSPAAGKVQEIKVATGDSVSEGSLILMLEVGETSAPVEAPHPEGVQEPEAQAPSAAPPASAASEDAPAGSNGSAPAGKLAPVDEAGFAKAHASPSVRAFARELGVDLAALEGSGRKGRIIRDDVTAFFKRQGAAASTPGAPGAEGVPAFLPYPLSTFPNLEKSTMSRCRASRKSRGRRCTAPG